LNDDKYYLKDLGKKEIDSQDKIITIPQPLIPQITNESLKQEPKKIFKLETQNAIDFVDKGREKFPFRVHVIQTDNGHELQALFH
jgi:hypothetical protein